MKPSRLSARRRALLRSMTLLARMLGAVGTEGVDLPWVARELHGRLTRARATTLGEQSGERTGVYQ
jgi:hypothetical protein